MSLKSKDMDLSNAEEGESKRHGFVGKILLGVSKAYRFYRNYF
jgi:hypothetical protein